MVHTSSTLRRRVLTAVAVAGTLLASSSGIAYAAPSDTPDEQDQVVFDIGNGVFAHLQPVTSQIRFTTPTPLTWDPNLWSENRYDVGKGWTFGETFVDLTGVPKFYLPDYGRSFEWDPLSPSGLRDYPTDDLRANVIVEGGELPARGEIPARRYVYTLQNLDTMVTEYFAADGDVLAAVNSFTGAREDWVWHEDDPARLLDRIVDEDGGVTSYTRGADGDTFIFPDGRSVLIDTDGRVGVSRIVTEFHTTFLDLNDRGWSTRTVETTGAELPLEYTGIWYDRVGNVNQVLQRRGSEGWRILWTRGGE